MRPSDPRVSPLSRLRPRSRHDAGFNLTEMVLVIVIMGILAVMLFPRYSRTPFYERGFYDEVASAARYARRLAVVSGCEVQLAISSNAYALTQRATNCTTGAFTRDVLHPGGRAAAFSGSAPEGITLSMTGNPVVFNALGNASDQVNRTVTVGSTSFQIIGASGFVQAP